MQNSNYYGILLSVILTASAFFPSAFATYSSNYNILAIEYSQGCETAIKNNVSTGCPPLKDLIKYDTSNQLISGKFIIKNNQTIREMPRIHNHYQFYHNGTVVCVECWLPLVNVNDFQTIFIEPKSFTWVDKNSVSPDGKWNSYNGRSMQGCNIATIPYSDQLLNDTIYLMKSGCTMTDNFPANHTNTIQDHPKDFKDAMIYKYLAWLQAAKESSHYKNCINHKCKTPKSPFSNPKW